MELYYKNNKRGYGILSVTKDRGYNMSMLTVNPKEYGVLLYTCFLNKVPFFIQGGPGIGKSEIPRQIFGDEAEKQGLIFMEWSDATKADKIKAIGDPTKYFVFHDARTSQMDTTALQGVPNMNNAEMLENIPYSWVVYFTTVGANGVIFFDEINLAAPIVQSITYSAINDRVISDRRMADNVYVFAAGNRTKDQAHTFKMPLPLRDRFAECEIKHNTDDWLEWAISNGVNPHIISFIGWKPGSLYTCDTCKGNKPTTPRGVVRCSDLIKGLDIVKDEDEVHSLASIAAGESFATNFQAYVKCYKKLNWEKLFKNPASVQDLELSAQWAISAGVAERFQTRPADLAQAEKLFLICEHQREDFTINSLRMMRDFNPKAFSDLFKKMKKGRAYAQKYGKFILDQAV